MCTNLKLRCSCGKQSANIMNRDNILPVEVVRGVWCPECSPSQPFDPDRMIRDNGWIMEFRMEMAKTILAGKFGDSRHSIDPLFLFDHGYSSWNGFTPYELEQSLRERNEIRAECGSNTLEFIKRLKTWGLERVRVLSEQGWRKASMAA